MTMTPKEYHEWCKRTFPVGSRVLVQGTEFSGGYGSFEYEYVGTVVSHPFEWEESGDAESGPMVHLVRNALEIECDGVKRDECPVAPGDNPALVPDFVQLVPDLPLGWRTGREAMLRVEEDAARQAKSYQAYEDEERAAREAGGHYLCPKCGKRTLRRGTACTLGYPGHPGAEFSGYEHCEDETCGYAEMA